MNIDYNLLFNEHITEFCNKANQKISALFRIRNSLDSKHAAILCNSFIMSAFNYCPLIWMFCTKSAAKRIVSTHHRAIRAVNLDFNTPGHELYKVHNATPIHTRNLQLLLIEVYKTLHHLNPEFMWNLFSENLINYQLRRGKILKLPVMSARSGQNTFLFRSVMAWNHLPSQIKGAESLANLRNLLKSHNIYCQCTCCR